MNKGERNNNAKLNETDVKIIRGLSEKGYTSTQIGWFFSVDPSTIRSILTGKNWSHVK